LPIQATETTLLKAKTKSFIYIHENMIYLLFILIVILISAMIVRLYRIYDNPSYSISLADNFNIKEFTGKWYVISSLPNLLEYNSENLILKQSLNNDNSLKFTVTGNKEKNKKHKFILKGKMKAEYQDNRASLIVQFIWPFTYTARFVHISDNYEEMILTTHTKNRLWILSKNKNIDENIYQNLLNLCKKKTFNLEKLKKIHHD
jgi:apolipoprotein D and lipocalin family protein